MLHLEIIQSLQCHFDNVMRFTGKTLQNWWCDCYAFAAYFDAPFAFLYRQKQWWPHPHKHRWFGPEILPGSIVSPNSISSGMYSPLTSSTSSTATCFMVLICCPSALSCIASQKSLLYFVQVGRPPLSNGCLAKPSELAHLSRGNVRGFNWDLCARRSDCLLTLLAAGTGNDQADKYMLKSGHRLQNTFMCKSLHCW